MEDLMMPEGEKVSMENFALLRVLGKGAYGKVFLVRKVGGKDHNTIYAMKVLRKTRVMTKQKTLEHTMAERQVLERLRGTPFLVNLFYAFQTDTKLHIVMEYVRGGELFTHLCSRGHFDLEAARFVIAELVVAIDSLHQRKVIYRDLKLENILLDEEGHVKLTDFGLSKLFLPGELDRANSYCGTIEYMSPEVINRPEGGYSDVVDWWSLGVISFELLTGCSPFTVDGGQNSSKDIAKRILTKKVPFPKTMDAEARDFIGCLLEKKLEKRLGYGGVEEIKTHKFMQNIDWEAAEKRELKPVIVPRIGHDLDTQFFSAEFTSQPPLYSPAESPLNANTLFRGYSYVSPSVIFANDNVIGEELMAEDVNALLASSSFFAKYKLDKSETGLLGKGAFSVVRRCERVADGAQFAVKIVSQRFAVQAQREARILEMVQGHPNIVQLHDVHSDPLHFYLVMELLTGNELLERIRKLERFTESEAADIMRQLVSAVKYLHDKRIVHRDLKPENILFESVDSNARLRLVDFGFARLLPNPMEQQLKSVQVLRKMTPCFTLQYAAPEVLDVGDSQPEYNEQCDLWSLGVVLFTMLSGQVPFHARSRQESATEIMQRICRAEFSFDGDAWTNVSSDAKNLITGLLTVDPKKRLSMQELTAHMWLKSSASMDTPLQTPSILPSSADETFNETLRAFLHANRDGFHLLDVTAAPLMKRRGIKRQSGDKDTTGISKSSRVTQFECLPEEQEMEMTSSTSRPNNLGMMNYREPNSGTIRETRGSDSS
ncbi:CBN-RSKN-2 protein [Caenorhabditis brenneri]|uniref:Ribosomal protein S6 kinase n=1 Tax=Caenorhabditis brenneri TaxID=135651 RepID=G0MFR5_CAEBE|nr:CBN-RSKN-2 protein [Caenorhabditis brenneri]